MGGDFEYCIGLFIFVCPPPFFFAECGKSSSLQLEVSSGWTAEFEHGLFYATGCRYHNSARHRQSQISHLTHDSRSGGYVMSSTVVSVGSPFLLQPLPYQWKCKRCILIYVPLLSKEMARKRHGRDYICEIICL